MTKEIEKIILDIIIKEMELPKHHGSDDRNREIPVGVIGFNDSVLGATEKLQIAVQNVGSFPYSSRTIVTPVEGQDQMQEENIVTSAEDIQIDIMSKNLDARQRRFEILMALKSIYSQQMQEKEGFKIHRIPQTFTNSSGAEGGSNLNRFSVVVRCFTCYNKIKISSEYFNDFSARVDDEDTIDQPDGLIEINEKE